MMAIYLLELLAIGSINPDCPAQPNGCPGTAEERSAAIRDRARGLDLNRPWNLVRQDIVKACGLRVQRSTGHCFNDFNHVDCCAMDDGSTHMTNEESKVVGMHQVNFLGSHIVDASVKELGPGGSWCTCHLSSPDDVCHKQFGARTAFKLVWCGGTGVAAILDDYANILASGKPTADDVGAVPDFGGQRARQDSWRVLDASHNLSWAHNWRAACERVASTSSQDVDETAAHELGEPSHDEL